MRALPLVGCEINHRPAAKNGRASNKPGDGGGGGDAVNQGSLSPQQCILGCQLGSLLFVGCKINHPPAAKKAKEPRKRGRPPKRKPPERPPRPPKTRGKADSPYGQVEWQAHTKEWMAHSSVTNKCAGVYNTRAEAIKVHITAQGRGGEGEQ